MKIYEAINERRKDYFWKFRGEQLSEVLRVGNFLSTKANNAGQVWQLHGPFSISLHKQSGEEIFWWILNDFLITS